MKRSGVGARTSQAPLNAAAQAWLGFFAAGPAFANAFTTVDRLTALFVLNPTGTILTVNWEQVAAAAAAGG